MANWTNVDALIQAGDYNGAWNAAMAQGVGAADIASHVNSTFGTNWTPQQLIQEFAPQYQYGGAASEPAPVPQQATQPVATPTPAVTPTQPTSTPDAAGTTYNFGANQIGMLGIDPSLISRGYEDLNGTWQTQQSAVPRQNPDGSWSVYDVKEVAPGQYQAVDSGARAGSQQEAIGQYQTLANRSSGFMDDLLNTVMPLAPIALAGAGMMGYLGGGSAFGGAGAAGGATAAEMDAMLGAGGYNTTAAGGLFNPAVAGIAGSAAGSTLGGAAAPTIAGAVTPAVAGGATTAATTGLGGLLAGLPSGSTGALIGAGANLIGGALQNSTNRDIAAQNSANIDAQNKLKQFRPVGMTTRFGNFSPTFDANGVLTSAGYNLNPDVKMLQDRQIGMVGGLQGDWEKAVQLGRGAMKTPEQYMQEQLGLLAPTRNEALATLQNQLQQQGRLGVNVMGGGTPEMFAYRKAIEQENARLAANAPTQSIALANQGLGLMSQGYQPLGTAIGAITGLEQLGQQAMDMGTTIGGQQSTANARLQTPQVPNQVNPLTAGLMGGVNAYQQYQNRQPITTQNPYVPQQQGGGMISPDYSQLDPGWNGYGDNPWGY
jgi:hypothetical protein